MKYAAIALVVGAFVLAACGYRFVAYHLMSM